MRNFHVSGKVEASSGELDMRLQRMLGHIPALLHPDPKSVLIVGCGAGVTAGSFTRYPGIERIVICEIEPLIPKVVADYFDEQNYDVVNPFAYPGRVEIVYDDARNYVFTTQEKFDIITSDPIHPWVKGAAALYTEEYFHMVKQHLNPGGVVTQWVPLYESTPDVVQSEFKTFYDVFPHGTLWSNDDNGEGYDVVLLGQEGELHIDIDALETRLKSPAYAPVAASMADVGFHRAIDLLATYAGRAADLAPWLAGAEVNRDRDLRLQYLAGLGNNEYLGGAIFDSIRLYYHFPEAAFSGSDAAMAEIRAQLAQKNTLR
jgi:spermidine synthase